MFKSIAALQRSVESAEIEIDTDRNQVSRENAKNDANTSLDFLGEVSTSLQV